MGTNLKVLFISTLIRCNPMFHFHLPSKRQKTGAEKLDID